MTLCAQVCGFLNVFACFCTPCVCILCAGKWVSAPQTMFELQVGAQVCGFSNVLRICNNLYAHACGCLLFLLVRVSSDI